MNHIAPCGHQGIPVTPNFVTCPVCDKANVPAPTANPFRSPAVAKLPPGKYRASVDMQQGVVSGGNSAIVLKCTVVSNTLLRGQTFAIPHVFHTRDEEVDGEIVRVPTVASDYAAARVRAYVVAAIAGDLNGVYISRTHPEESDFMKFDDGRAHTVDVTVTEFPYRGGTINRYAWETVAHRS